MTDENNKPTDATTWRCPKCGWSGLHTETKITPVDAPGEMRAMARACPACMTPVQREPQDEEERDAGDEEQNQRDNLEGAVAKYAAGETVTAFFWVLVDIASSLRGIEEFPARLPDALAKFAVEMMKIVIADKAKIMDAAFNFGMKRGFAGATAQAKSADPPPDEKAGPLTLEEIAKLAEQLKGEDKP